MSELRKAKTFISYIEDNGEQTSGYFDLIDVTDSLVTFSTEKNIIHIPTSRIIKIKESKEKK